MEYGVLEYVLRVFTPEPYLKTDDLVHERNCRLGKYALDEPEAKGEDAQR